MLARDGLFFPIDPGADATLGGMTATRASGTNAVRYGTMKDNVLGVTAVLADGSVVHTGTRARKSSAGYDLTRLLVGSEGTLGVITEVSLRLYGLPEVIGGAVCSFATLAGAVRTVIEAIQMGIPASPASSCSTRCRSTPATASAGSGCRVAPLLLVEFHGSAVAVEDQAAAFAGLARAHGGAGWQSTTDAAERDRLWAARHQAYYAGKALRPGALAIPTDVCVPISRLAECILDTRADIDASGLVAPIVGHVGDGNFHVVVLFDPDVPAELEPRPRPERAAGRPGPGHGRDVHGRARDRVRQARVHGRRARPRDARDDAPIKSALDPTGILNPGKVLPVADG